MDLLHNRREDQKGLRPLPFSSRKVSLENGCLSALIPPTTAATWLQEDKVVVETNDRKHQAGGSRWYQSVSSLKQTTVTSTKPLFLKTNYSDIGRTLFLKANNNIKTTTSKESSPPWNVQQRHQQNLSSLKQTTRTSKNNTNKKTRFLKRNYNDINKTSLP